jgi:3-deoxy-D-manno-octulosonic-acid transferase
LYYQLYNALLILVLSIGFPVFFPFALLSGNHRRGLPERFGFLRLNKPYTPGQFRIWLHAASVGEVQAAKALLPALKARFPEAVFLISTMTEQGRSMARSQLDADMVCFLAPLDLPLTVRRAIRRVKPDLYICLETELWPNLLLQLRIAKCRLVLLNGRISERSFNRYLMISGFMNEVLACFDRISAISSKDAERFAALGAAPHKIKIHGNVKYDRELPEAGQIRNHYQQLLGLKSEQPVLMAGSTHPGEEQILLDVYHELKTRWPDITLVIAPRHLQRLADVEQLLEKSGVRFDRLSDISHRKRRHAIVLANTMGELANLYAIATYIFVGGSLVDYGGHNIMEAAAWGKPVFYGPYLSDFSDAKELLEEFGAGFEVDGAASMIAAILSFADDPERYLRAAGQAEAAFASQRGSASRQAEMASEKYN